MQGYRVTPFPDFASLIRAMIAAASVCRMNAADGLRPAHEPALT
jgi:hypothetical protein